MNKYPQTKAGSNSTATGERRRKTEGYSSAVLHAKRDQKRQQAEARQRDSNGRTARERLALLDSRPGRSQRERTRLLLDGVKA